MEMADPQHVLQRGVGHEDLVERVTSPEAAGASDDADNREHVLARLDRPSDGLGARSEELVARGRREHGNLLAGLDLAASEEPPGLRRQHAHRSKVGVASLQSHEERRSAGAYDCCFRHPGDR